MRYADGPFAMHKRDLKSRGIVRRRLCFKEGKEVRRYENDPSW